MLKSMGLLLFTLVFFNSGCAKSKVQATAFKLSSAKRNRLLTLQSSPTGGSKGKLRMLQVDSGLWTEADQPTYQNAIAKAWPELGGTGLIGVVNRFPNDNFQFFSLPNLKSQGSQLAFNEFRETVTKDGLEETLPNSFQDLLLMKDGETTKGYVTRLNGRSILSFVLGSKNKPTKIELPKPYADEDGFAEPNNMALEGNTLFVQLLRLDRNDPFWVPTQGSQIIAIDTRTDKIIKILDGLEGTNPAPEFKRDAKGTLYVATTGKYAERCEICGLQPVMTEELRLGKPLVTEAQLRGKIEAFEFAGDRVFVQLRKYKEEGRGTKLVSFPVASPHSVSSLGTTEGTDEYKAILYDSERNLIFASRDSVTQPEIEIFDAKTGDRKAIIETELPAQTLELVE